jgi:hypothetical protein
MDRPSQGKQRIAQHKDKRKQVGCRVLPATVVIRRSKATRVFEAMLRQQALAAIESGLRRSTRLA